MDSVRQFINKLSDLGKSLEVFVQGELLVVLIFVVLELLDDFFEPVDRVRGAALSAFALKVLFGGWVNPFLVLKHTLGKKCR
jgi:hypothetical protein